MRRLSFLFLPVLVLAPGLAMAQNYSTNDNYKGPAVIVNMDVLGAAVPPTHPLPLSLAERPVVKTEPKTSAPTPIRSAVKMPAPQPAPVARPAMPMPAAMSQPVPSAMTAPAAKMDDLLLDDTTKPAAPQPKTASVSQPPAPAEIPTAPKPAPAEIKPAAPEPAPFVPDNGIAEDELAPILPPPVLTEETKPAAKPQTVEKIQPVVQPVTPQPVPSPVIAEETKAVVKPAAPQPAPAAKPEPQPKQAETTGWRLVFEAKSDALKPNDQVVLDKIIARLKDNAAARLQILSYADGTPDNAGQARRVSLTRAMKLREYILTQGISASRLDIRALGIGSAEMGDSIGGGKAPADHADITLIP